MCPHKVIYISWLFKILNKTLHKEVGKDLKLKVPAFAWSICTRPLCTFVLHLGGVLLNKNLNTSVSKAHSSICHLSKQCLAEFSGSPLDLLFLVYCFFICQFTNQLKQLLNHVPQKGPIPPVKPGKNHYP